MRRRASYVGVASPPLVRALARIRADRIRGAGELALELLDGLKAEVRGWGAKSAGNQLRSARTIARGLREIQPAMGVFIRWAEEWESIVAKAHRRAVASTLSRWAARWNRGLEAEPDRIAKLVRNRLPPGVRIVTISRSSTMAHALESLPPDRRPGEVVALESLPGGEGRGLARELRQNGLRARWIRDRSVESALEGAGLVLLGADTVESDGAIVHKVGTRPLAAEASRRGIPVVVVAGRSKWQTRNARRRPLPRLFDRTPAGLITEFWTDRGVVPGGRRPSGRRSHQRKEDRTGRPRGSNASRT
jgi:ribose 1,5-bisphosphate isomerase